MRKVKNSIKKMMALCLAAIMTLAMATTAFAADRIKTGNLTVNVNEGNTHYYKTHSFLRSSKLSC